MPEMPKCYAMRETMHVRDSDYWKAAAIEASHAGIHWRVVTYAAGRAETAEEFDAYIQAAIHAAERLKHLQGQSHGNR